MRSIFLEDNAWYLGLMVLDVHKIESQSHRSVKNDDIKLLCDVVVQPSHYISSHLPFEDPAQERVLYCLFLKLVPQQDHG